MADNLRSLFLLDPKVTFLNHGSFGACPRPVFERYQAWQMKLERQPVAFLDPARGLSGWLRDARMAMAGLVGVGPDSIVGLTNATEGLNIVAQSLRLAPGDEILTTDHEYAAIDKTFAYVARRSGARVVTVVRRKCAPPITCAPTGVRWRSVLRSANRRNKTGEAILWYGRVLDSVSGVPGATGCAQSSSACRQRRPGKRAKSRSAVMN